MSRKYALTLSVVLGLSLSCCSWVLGATKDENVNQLRTTYRAWKKLEAEGRLTKAHAEATKCLKAAEERYGADHAHTARIVNELSSLCCEVGLYDEAEQSANRYLQWAEDKYGDDDVAVAQPLYVLGRIDEIRRQLNKSEEYLKRSLKIYEASKGPDDPEVAKVLSEQARLYLEFRRYAEAEKLALRALKIQQDKYGKDSLEAARVMLDLGQLYRFSNQFRKGKSHLDHCRKVFEEKLNPEHPLMGYVLLHLGGIDLELARYDQAIKYYEQARAIWDKTLIPDHLHVGFIQHNLGFIAERRQDLNKAMELYEDALRIKQNATGKESIESAKTIGNLGIVNSRLGQFDRAETLMRNSLEIKEKKLGKDNVVLVSDLNNLSIVMHNTGRFSDSLSYLERSLDIAEKKLGVGHSETLLYRSNLARRYHNMGRVEEANAMVESALRKSIQVLGKEHPQTAALLENLAWIHAASQDWETAASIMEQCVAIFKKTYGPEHPDVAECLNKQAGFEGRIQGNIHKAASIANQSRRIMRRYVANVLPGLSDREQLRFLETKDHTQYYFDLGFAMFAPEDPKVAEYTAAWVLNGKALTMEVLSDNIVRMRESGLPEINRLNRELVETREEYAAMLLRELSAEEDLNTHKERFDALRKKQDGLAKQLAGLTGEPKKQDPWVEIDQVRDVIDENKVLVELSRIPAIKTKKVQGRLVSQPTQFYGAWVIPPKKSKKKVKFVPLAPAEEVDNAILAYHKAIMMGPAVIKRAGERPAVMKINHVVRDLSKQLLDPLREHLSEYENWMIAPDGLTWYLPFSALLWDETTYVVERHTISYLMSGRDLLAPSSKAETSGPLVAAAPNYNMGLLPSETQNEPYGPLPGTEKEVKLIAPLMKHLAGGPPRILKRNEATEMAVKAAQRPETLVLSTHAFFLPAPPRSGINPLLRCGLAFAGANDPKRRDQEDNDGTLTGMEVLGIDLRGTELVMLSACQTGMGELTNAEGVSGLRQAFHLAGAENVAATLWSIPDIETADLVKNFFVKRAMGEDDALALRNAQMEVIRNRRKEYGEAHPVYWAAFTLTKRGR